MALVTDAYAAAGVDTHEADRGVGRSGRACCAAIEPGRSSLAVPLPGHYASVIAVAPGLGIALATDSVGSKVIVAEQAQRFDTIGIDCVAMNVNDLICVGAEPLALLDYIAVEQADPELLRELAVGSADRRRGGRRRDPGGRGLPAPRGDPRPSVAVRVRPRRVGVRDRRARPDRRRQPLRRRRRADRAAGLGRALQRADARPRGAAERGGLALDAAPAELGGASVADVLLEPTVIYVRAVLELLRSDVPVHGLAHITGGGLLNLLRLGDGVGYRIDSPLPVPPVFELIAELGEVSPREMWEVFNMGCGFCAIVPADARRRSGRAAGAPPPGDSRGRPAHRARGDASSCRSCGSQGDHGRSAAGLSVCTRMPRAKRV